MVPPLAAGVPDHSGSFGRPLLFYCGARYPVTVQGDEMHGPKGWNINTYISIGGFVILLAGMIYTEGQSSQKLQSTVDAFASYQTDTDNRIAQIEAQTRQLD